MPKASPSPPDRATPAPPLKLGRQRRSPSLLLPRRPCLHPMLRVEVRSLHPSKPKRPEPAVPIAARRPSVVHPQRRDAPAVARATSLNLLMSLPCPQLRVGANRVQNHALELFPEFRRRARRRRRRARRRPLSDLVQTAQINPLPQVNLYLSILSPNRPRTLRDGRGQRS
jgi:hypothetical protein